MIKRISFAMLLLSTILFAGCSSDKDKNPKKEKELSQSSSNLENCYEENKLFKVEEIGEPSGIVFDSKRGNLFVVSDEGSVYETSREGVLIKGKKISDGDFEGITINFQKDLLYVAVENEEKILEINPEDFSIVREFFINRYFNNKLVLEEGGNGIEGLYYDEKRNSFFVVNQDIDLDKENDKSALIEVEYPEEENGDILNILNYYYSKTEDLSSITKNKESNNLLIVSDKENKLMKFSDDNEFQDVCLLAGEDQEGLTFDDKGNAFVAQDSGGILKLFNKN